MLLFGGKGKVFKTCMQVGGIGNGDKFYLTRGLENAYDHMLQKCTFSIIMIHQILTFPINTTVGLFSISHSPSLNPSLFCGLAYFSLNFS